MLFNIQGPQLNCYSSGPENVTEILIKVRGRSKDLVFGGTSTLFECVTEFNVWAIEWRVLKIRQNHHPGLNASTSAKNGYFY